MPTRTDPGTQDPNTAARGTMPVMARIAGIGTIEILPTREVEFITLNAARDLQRFLEREAIRSMIVVTRLVRSRRSALVGAAPLGSADTTVQCQPVQTSRGVNLWARSWHDIQEAVQQ